MRAAVVFLAGWCSLSGCWSQGEPEEADAHPSTSPSDQADTSDAPAAPTADPPAEKAPLRATHIAAGAGTSYARMSDGTIRAWGDGSVFALGRAQAGPVGRPLEVEITIGSGFGCAVMEDATVKCWGNVPGWPTVAIGDHRGPTTVAPVVDAPSGPSSTDAPVDGA